MAPKRVVVALTMLIGVGNALTTGVLAQSPTITHRGESTVVQFDVSPPLSTLALQPPTNPGPTVNIDPPSGLEGPLGPQDVDAQRQDPVRQSNVGAGEIPTPTFGFDAFNNGSFPPDPVGAVGPNHYVVMANSVYSVHSKTGTLLVGPANINTLWAGFGGACESENAGDPIVLYDRLANRWLLTQFTAAGPTFFNCVALSQTGDPTGPYFRWAFSTGGNFPDYPKYGVWPDAYYISTREFAGAVFAGVGAYALNRAQMIAGNPAPQVISFLAAPGGTPYTVGDGLLPSDLDGTTLPPPGSPNFFIGSRDNGGPYGAPSDALNVFRFHVDFAVPGNSTFTGPVVVPVAAFDSILDACGGTRNCIPQPGTAQLVDHLGYRQRPLHRAAYRNFGTHESIVTNQSVEAAGGISGVRWWELRNPNGTPTIFQEGTYAPGDGIHRWMGSIAQDKQGNMALGYSVSNAAVFPGIRYTGRLAADPLGTMPQGEGTFVNGAGSQTGGNRWGDYTAMTIDPTDDCTFWYVNQYLQATGGTKTLRVGAFRYPQCSRPLSCTFQSRLADFNADLRADIAMRRADGQLAIYLLNTFQISAAGIAGSIGSEWQFVGQGDFSGDGRSDLLFRRITDGALAIYNMSGTSIIAAQILGTIGTEWNVVGVGDFNGDAKADILFRRTTDGMFLMFQMNGFQIVAAQLVAGVGLEWKVQGVNDLNGDGKADMVMRRTSDGMLAAYLFNGFQIVAGQLVGVVGTEWTVIGVADFNGDNRADLLARREDGTLAMYLMNGTQLVAAQLIGAIGTEWNFAGTGDLNADFRSDLVLRRGTDGALQGYLMNGFQIVSSGLIGTIGPEWNSCYGQGSIIAEAGARQ